MRVLSIDPALRNTGFAVIEKLSGDPDPPFQTLVYGVIKNAPKIKQSGCLVHIREQLDDVIREHRPEICAIESVIYVQSFQTAITMGAARAAALIAAGEHGLPIYEYAPKRVKQAVVGKGAADKQQVAFMMRSILRLTETPDPDAADALAIGVTHFYASERDPALAQDVKEV